VTLLWSCPRCYMTFLKSLIISHYLPSCLSLSAFPLPAFLPHSPLWCSDPLLGQILILYFHSVITWAAVFLVHILIIWHISFLPSQASTGISNTEVNRWSF
jgi:hypothetical protein